MPLFIQRLVEESVGMEMPIIYILSSFQLHKNIFRKKILTRPELYQFKTSCKECGIIKTTVNMLCIKLNTFLV